MAVGDFNVPCYHPLTGYFSKQVNVSGKRSLVFTSSNALLNSPIQVPCGRCIGCRLDRSLSWALRCVHEASLYDKNCFITLTFSGDHPKLRVCDFQNFMKRLRQKIAPDKVRFFHCGEYGSKYSRPHHHACLFGYDFPDKVLFKDSSGGKIYTSPILEALWPFGFSTIGDVTFESAAYVARYVLKKWSKEDLKSQGLFDAMVKFDKDSNKFFAATKCGLSYNGLKPEYITMSRRPGIGADWFKRFSSDVYPGGFCVVNGKRVRPPKFYDSKYEIDNIMSMAMIKGKRLMAAQDNPDNKPARLVVREMNKLQAVKQLTRGYEDGT